jgi:hypothetical protein
VLDVTVGLVVVDVVDVAGDELEPLDADGVGDPGGRDWMMTFVVEDVVTGTVGELVTLLVGVAVAVAVDVAVEVAVDVAVEVAVDVAVEVAVGESGDVDVTVGVGRG